MDTRRLKGSTSVTEDTQANQTDSGRIEESTVGTESGQSLPRNKGKFLLGETFAAAPISANPSDAVEEVENLILQIKELLASLQSENKDTD